MNFNQAGVPQAVFAYFTMIPLIAIMIMSVLPDTFDDKQRGLAFLIFYPLLFIWYLTISIRYFI